MWEAPVVIPVPATIERGLARDPNSVELPPEPDPPMTRQREAPVSYQSNREALFARARVDPVPVRIRFAAVPTAAEESLMSIEAPVPLITKTIRPSAPAARVPTEARDAFVSFTADVVGSATAASEPVAVALSVLGAESTAEARSTPADLRMLNQPASIFWPFDLSGISEKLVAIILVYSTILKRNFISTLTGFTVIPTPSAFATVKVCV